MQNYSIDGATYYSINGNPAMSEMKEAVIALAQRYVTGDLEEKCLQSINAAFDNANSDYLHFEDRDGKRYFVSYPMGTEGAYNFDYSGLPAHPGRSLAQPDRASAHLIRSAFQPMLAAD